MFCAKCGNRNPDGARFCQSCGSPMIVQSAEKTPGTVEAVLSRVSLLGKNQKIIIGVIAVVLFIWLISGGGGRSSYEETMDQYFSAVAYKNVEAYLDLFPNEIVTLVEKGYDSKQQMLDDVEYELSNHWINSDSKALSYQITGTYDLSPQAFQELQEYLSEEYDIEISEAMYVEVYTSYSWEDLMEYRLIKIGGSWYLENASWEGSWFFDFSYAGDSKDSISISDIV